MKSKEVSFPNYIPVSEDKYLREGDRNNWEKKKNHLFRKSLNTNVLIPMGVDEVERSMMLGHSERVDYENYTYQGSYKYCGILEKTKKSRPFTQIHSNHTPDLTGKVVAFRTNKKAFKASV